MPRLILFTILAASAAAVSVKSSSRSIDEPTKLLQQYGLDDLDDPSDPYYPASEDCEEPADPGQAFNGMGPVKVYCCKTAKAKVIEYERRQRDCNDAVPCSNDLREILPDFLDYYRGQVEELCTNKPRTTTRWAFTDEPTTTPAPAETTTTTVDGMAWCYDLCNEGECQAEGHCEKMCSEVANRMENELVRARKAWGAPRTHGGDR
jgi:hypothetical protein|mmetsp:Transcript_64781/g.190014  ORF Transcript_64781/g.190014 Transcript_64781/m.190014 type:complete len:206 (-) Transcript_64781:55-672(-)